MEGLNYLSHSIQYEKISKINEDNEKIRNKKNKKDKKKVKLHAKTMKDDLLNHFKNFNTNIDMVFGGRTRSLSKTEIHDSLAKIIYSPYHKNIKSSSLIFEIINKYEEKINEKLLEFNKNYNQTDINEPLNELSNESSNESLKVWYKPLPLVLTFEAITMYSDVTMFLKGFNKFTYENGLVIWIKKGTTKENDAIIFLHAGAGGIVVQLEFINKLPETHTIIIPEIPGISFGGRVFVPPTIREISELIVDFSISLKMSSLQLISHSFGGNIISCIINNYVKKLEKNKIKLINTTLVEPIIFLPSLFSVYKLLNEDINSDDVLNIIKNDSSKLLSYILIFRDIYAQYYSKCLTMTDVLMGTTDYEKNNCINIILSEYDELYSASECEHYLKSKKYNCNIIMRKNNYHGDFCFNKETHNIVVGLII